MYYSLNDFAEIQKRGFQEIILPQKSIDVIVRIAAEVGSPTYVKTPNFAEIAEKKEKERLELELKRAALSEDGLVEGGDEWIALRSFQATKIEKTTTNTELDDIRFILNKLSDANYHDNLREIISLIETFAEKNDPNALKSVCVSILDLASNNRFFSKIYADVYSTLVVKFEIFGKIFDESLEPFLLLFDKIEWCDPEKDYALFCKCNKDNEKRRALSAFLLNMTLNRTISADKLFSITFRILDKLLNTLSDEDKTNEVDEMTENVVVLFEPELFKKCTVTLMGFTFPAIVDKVCRMKLAKFKSLSNKAKFKFMDMKEMLEHKDK